MSLSSNKSGIGVVVALLNRIISFPPLTTHNNERDGLDDDDTEIRFRRRFLAEFRDWFIDVEKSLIRVFLERREGVWRVDDGFVVGWCGNVGVRNRGARERGVVTRWNDLEMSEDFVCEMWEISYPVTEVYKAGTTNRKLSTVDR